MNQRHEKSIQPARVFVYQQREGAPYTAAGNESPAALGTQLTRGFGRGLLKRHRIEYDERYFWQ
jgi:hypothetical protein